MEIARKMTGLLFMAALSFGLVGGFAGVDKGLPIVFAQARNEALVQFLYQVYDTHKDNFVNSIPVDVTVTVAECKQVLMAKQEAVKQVSAGVSYKNVFFSASNIARMGLIAAGSMAYSEDIYGLYAKAAGKVVRPLVDLVGANKASGLMSVGVFLGLPAILQTISGFGLYKDIKAVRDKKNQLSTELNKINKMLELLEKSQ